MNPQDDWSRWGGDWQQQSAIDVDRLRRQVHRKRKKIGWMVAIEAMLAVAAAVQLVRLLHMPGLAERGKIWVVLMFFMVAASLCRALWIRRGTWRAVTRGVPDLLRLTAKRARADIRMAQLNMLGMPVLVAITLPFAAPWLAPSRWLNDPALQRMLLLQIGVNGVVITGLMIFFASYIRRQRRRLREVEALLRDYVE